MEGEQDLDETSTSEANVRADVADSAPMSDPSAPTSLQEDAGSDPVLDPPASNGQQDDGATTHGTPGGDPMPDPVAHNRPQDDSDAAGAGAPTELDPTKDPTSPSGQHDDDTAADTVGTGAVLDPAAPNGQQGDGAAVDSTGAAQVPGDSEPARDLAAPAGDGGGHDQAPTPPQSVETPTVVLEKTEPASAGGDQAEHSTAVPAQGVPTSEVPEFQVSTSPTPPNTEFEDVPIVLGVPDGAPGVGADGGEPAGVVTVPVPGADGAAGADGDGVTVPVPAISPGFRPYSETPVYSDPGQPEPPATPAPAAAPPPPAEPCSGDWHRKTVDDLIAMDVPDVRIPRCLRWGPCEIRGWLGRLGLPQYAEALLANNICGRSLCLLTASNLPRMGITDWEHIRTIAGSARQLLSIDDYVLYDHTFERPPPGPMTRALYLQCARPSGQPPPSSQRYLKFLRQYGFLDVLAELTNRPVVDLPKPQTNPLYREITVASVQSVVTSPTSPGSS